MSAEPSLRILVVGQTILGSRTPQRVAAMAGLGHRVETVAINRDGATYEDRPSLMERIRYRLRLPADPAGANRELARRVTDGFDVVWIEAAPMIRAATLRTVRRLAPHTPIVWYGEDDMMNPRHLSRWLKAAIPLFDLWVTTKSFNAAPDELPALGARNVLFVDNSFDSSLHRPAAPDDARRARLAADVSFVGTYEAPRAASLLALAQAGVAVRVWGNGWQRMADTNAHLVIEGRPVYDDEYAAVISASRINLGFLRKGNRDLQTCRTVEIPACGGFMLHEHSDEACRLFRPDHEAAFFHDDTELVEQCRHWLADEAGRQRVAAAGRARALKDGYDHAHRLAFILNRALDGKGTKR
ncbi:CgeB family protein [Magnetospirillum aberrantis]|uniref:Glycosyltransferase n=1 Tax=Magnetospirillum aberrantis SpK TaxID=908842 RepID=A0A7C9QXB1_9PROT|nr:glycosyltransferase [Magnetospirillum aberrantis]NFV81556.1 glycosyltransferase [Magnetospirillum aberrantis SpK]